MEITLPDSVKKIIHILEQHGYEAYAVGGCVRDSLLGEEPKDWDITTSAKPEEVKALFPRTIDTGILHGTVTVMMHHVGYEVTTYRIDGEYEDGRHPKAVSFTSSLIEDLKRRDFTINAMAYSDRTGIVDEFDGMGDLERKVVRCVGKAEERFEEDALRILRALRFSAKLGFDIDEETGLAIRRLSHTLVKISRERIQAELEKLIMSPHPDRITLLQTENILPYLFQDCSVVPMDDDLDEKKRIFQLSEMLMSAPCEHYVRWALVITLLPYERMLRSLKFDNQTIKICEKMKTYADVQLESDKAFIRKFCVQIGRDIFASYYLPYRKVLGNISVKVLNEVWEAYNEIKENKDCLSLKELKINGTDLQAEGIATGKQIGEILNALFAQVLENPDLNERNILLEMAKKS